MKKPEDTGPPSDPPIQTPQANHPQDQQPALMEEVPVAPSQPATHPPEINADKTREIKSKVDTATKTMEQNIQAATQRGESLNDLQDKTRTRSTIVSMKLIFSCRGCGRVVEAV